MSSASTTPIDLFQSLTLDPQMSATSADIRSRAVEVRDVLSSFDRDILPSEFRTGIFSELDRPSLSRPPVAQWTIQEDLPSTLLQWGAYNDRAYELLISLQSAPTLARCFYEKLGRRFDSLFSDYDRLSEAFPIARDDIQRVAHGFRMVVAAVQDDRSHRQLGHEAIVKRLLEAMIGVCRRHTDILPASQTPTVPRRGTRRTASTSMEGAANLFEALIKNPLESLAEHPFMLDLLETFPANVFNNLQSEHENLVSLLDINDAPAAFKYRVGRLPSGSSSNVSKPATTQPVENPKTHFVTIMPAEPSGNKGSSSQAQASTRKSTPVQAPTSTTGSKRASEETGPSSKRGRKKQAQ